MHSSLTGDAALPVWYQEQLDRVQNIMAVIDVTTDPDMKEALTLLARMHTARARVLEALMAEALGR